jgi:tetratricopeptide (TPR) repeat protein
MLDSEHVDMALRLAARLAHFWQMHGHNGEGRDWLNQVLTLRSASSDTLLCTRARADALCGAGFLALRQCDFAAARSLFEESLAISRELGDLAGVAKCMRNLGILADDQGDYPQAIRLHRQSHAIRRGLRD